MLFNFNMKFTRIEENVNQIKSYFERSEISFCDISAGVRFMWGEEYVVEYAVVNDTLIMKENGPDYGNCFYYPMGADVDGALNEIEKYCRENFIPLRFCCIDNLHAAYLASRYNDVKIVNDRDWDDYIYSAEKFKTYSGKKFSGQRNHVNKFKKSYPNYLFKNIEKSDLPRIREFLNEYEDGLVGEAALEAEMAFKLTERIDELGQVGGYLEVDGKTVAFSVGETVGDTLIVHIEKALTVYDGVYPTMAQEFVKAFAGNGIKFVNREEDCGDEGLRISKLQYRPIEIKEKNAVLVRTLFDKITFPIFLKTERLTVTDICEEDKKAYARLYLDDDLNKWWGYDYREDLNDEEPTPDYFYDFQKKLKNRKEEYSLAVRKNGTMIGELVLHNFDYFGGVEIGFRFFKEFQGEGYAIESASAVRDFAFNNLAAKTVKSRCFKENLPSAKLIKRLGLKKRSENETHYFFELTK